MEVKYQKVTYRRYFTTGRVHKVQAQHASGAFGPGADLSCLRQGSAPGRVGEDAVQKKVAFGNFPFAVGACGSPQFFADGFAYKNTFCWKILIKYYFGANLEPKNVENARARPKNSQK